MYYVYIHKLKQTDEVVYCGKGSNQRFRDYNSRNNEHLSLMKSGQLDYVILEFFDNEEDAYKIEEKITEQYKQSSQCKFNIAIGRRTSEQTKQKLSKVLKGKTRSKETKERIKVNHARPLAKKVLMFNKGILIRTFRSSREAGQFAAGNGICSYSWCSRSLKTGEHTKPTKKFPLGGFLFIYENDKIEL